MAAAATWFSPSPCSHSAWLFLFLRRGACSVGTVILEQRFLDLLPGPYSTSIVSLLLFEPFLGQTVVIFDPTPISRKGAEKPMNKVLERPTTTHKPTKKTRRRRRERRRSRERQAVSTEEDQQATSAAAQGPSPRDRTPLRRRAKTSYH